MRIVRSLSIDDKRILFGNLEYFALSHNETEFVVEVLEDFQWTLCLDHLLGRHLQAPQTSHMLHLLYTRCQAAGQVRTILKFN